MVFDKEYVDDDVEDYLKQIDLVELHFQEDF
jgi:hypothetical protein